MLQLSSLDLQQEIQLNLESNPFLEEQGAEILPEDTGLEPTEIEESPQLSFSDDLTIDSDADFSAEDFTEKAAEDWVVRSEPETVRTKNEGSVRSDIDTSSLLENVSGTRSLIDYLDEQIKQTPMSRKQALIASVLVENINDDGYLDLELAEVHKLLPEGIQITESEFNNAVKLIQQLDPTGVGARDLPECLLLQLESMSGDDNDIADAHLIVSQHMQALSTRDFSRLKKHSGLDHDRLVIALNIIRSLDPKPAQRLSSLPAAYIVPDILVKKATTGWQVELNSDNRTNLGLSPAYRTYLSADGSSEDSIYFKQRYQDAKWFLQSLKQRNETIILVAMEIVGHQCEFFEHGPSHMKPLTLKRVAEKLSLHESTISRATNQKFMLSPRGIHELKFFFSSQLETESGENSSSTAIQAQIRQLINGESGKKPISDQRISDHFKSRGVHIARRTVAKYREQMNIPSSSQRKSLI